MTSPRPKLHLARSARKPSLALVKKALRLFAGQGIPREVRHSNARKWLCAMAQLGDKHLLRGGEVSWGVPGDHGIRQVFASRRLGERA